MHCSYNTFLVSTIKNRLPEDVWVGVYLLMGSACTGIHSAISMKGILTLLPDCRNCTKGAES